MLLLFLDSVTKFFLTEKFEFRKITYIILNLGYLQLLLLPWLTISSISKAQNLSTINYIRYYFQIIKLKGKYLQNSSCYIKWPMKLVARCKNDLIVYQPYNLKLIYTCYCCKICSAIKTIQLKLQFLNRQTGLVSSNYHFSYERLTDGIRAKLNLAFENTWQESLGFTQPYNQELGPIALPIGS